MVGGWWDCKEGETMNTEVEYALTKTRRMAHLVLPGSPRTICGERVVAWPEQVGGKPRCSRCWGFIR